MTNFYVSHAVWCECHWPQPFNITACCKGRDERVSLSKQWNAARGAARRSVRWMLMLWVEWDWQAPRRATQRPPACFFSALTVNSFNIITWRAEVEAIIYYFVGPAAAALAASNYFFRNEFLVSSLSFTHCGRMRRVFVYWQNFATAHAMPNLHQILIQPLSAVRTNYYGWCV